MTDMDRKFLEIYNKIRKDPDRSILLSSHALLGFDDGREYTETEYQQAIRHLETGLKRARNDAESDFLAEGIHWCEIRLNAVQAV